MARKDQRSKPAAGRGAEDDAARGAGDDMAWSGWWAAEDIAEKLRTGIQIVKAPDKGITAQPGNQTASR